MAWRSTMAGCGLAVMITGCSTAPPEPRPLLPPPAPTTARPPTAMPSASPTIDPGERQALGEPESRELPFEVRPLPGRAGALVVSVEPDRARTYLRLADDNGQLGPVHVLEGRFLAAALGDDPPWLVTSPGDGLLCAERLGAEREQARCAPVRAHRLLRVGSRPMLLEERTIDPDDPDEPRKPGAPAKREPDAPKTSGEAEPDDEVRLWLRAIDATGNIGDVLNTEITFTRPLVGMGLLDAAGIRGGAHLLWYERLDPRREKGRKVPRALLRHARLDAEGKLVRSSRWRVMKGDRGYGHLEGHHAGRLATWGNAALYVGRFEEDGGKTQGYEAIRLSKPRGNVVADDALFGVDPERIARDEALRPEELTALKGLWSAAPRLSPGQKGRDLGRVAWAGDHGWFLKTSSGVTLHRFTLDEGIVDLPPPFVTQRSIMSWAAMESDGAGLAAVDGALVVVTPDGTTLRGGEAATTLAARPVRIGGAWWGLVPDGRDGARLRRLHPEPTDVAVAASLDAGRAALAGGPNEGLLLVLDHGRLRLWRITGGGKAEPLGSHGTDMRHGLVAASRADGGAIVAGIAERKRRVVALAVDGAGRLLTETSTTVPASASLWLRSRPGGGAWLADGARTMVAWLDEAARERARADWPQQEPGWHCIDGEPARSAWPSVEVGRFVELEPMAAPGTCLLDAPVLLANGLLRWLGSRTEGLHAIAELGRAAVLAPPTAPLPAPTMSPTNANGSKTTTACPPEMVSIRGQFCIDRFEGQLVDAADGAPLSPYYPTTPNLTQIILGRWGPHRWTTGDLLARAMPLPSLGRSPNAAPKAVARSRYGVVPSGYVSGHGAHEACEAAGKRLCSEAEWKTACRGEQERDFPYGDDYRQGACNVFRYGHPAFTLHDNPAIGHLDPRLNQVLDNGAPMLERTGSRPGCASRWGDDAVFDMVGNLDEWIDSKKGTFVGGFYSRSTRKGCNAKVSAHPRRYLDYSLGIRCCKKARP